MQENFSKLNQTHLDTLKKDGVIVLSNFISEQTINVMNKQISPWLKKVSFNNRISSFIIGNNQWIEHVGLCSLTALKLAVDDHLINFIEGYFGTGVTLGSFSLQRKIFPEKKLKLHSDKGGGLAIFLYLTNPSKESGLTEFISKSHATEIKDSYVLKNKIDDAIYIDIKKTPLKSKKYLKKTTGSKGTLVIFDRKTWHQLPKFEAPGREILMMEYYKKNSPTKDHLIKKSFLQSLSERQKEVYLSNCSSSSLSGLVELGSDPDTLGVYKIPNWKMLIYFLRYKLLSKV